MESERDMIKIQRRVLFLISTVLLSLIAGIFPIENCIASGNTVYANDDALNDPGPNDPSVSDPDEDGSIDHPFDTIQEAINEANANATIDTVYVYSGAYNENIEITKDLTLTGENKDTTIIDSAEIGHVIYAHGTSGNEITVHISGFKIQDANGLGYDCIALSYVNDGTINNNILKYSDNSNGIQLDHCIGNTINGNQITDNGGAGISLTLSTNNIIHTNVIQSNQKGIYVYLSSNNNQIYSNTISDSNQYGAYVRQSINNKFYLNDFTNNEQNAQDANNNEWDNGYPSGGNSWDDYEGIDEFSGQNQDDPGSDELGDIPYDIPGGNNQDRYPLGEFVNQDPEAYIDSITPNPATSGNTISFEGHGTDDGIIIEWEWKSNVDEGLSSSEDFSDSGLSEGTHTISFRVKDDDDKWSEYVQKTLIINPPGSQGDPSNPTENQEPVAFIDIISPNPVQYNKSVSFEGHGTDEDGTITEWKWTSGIDGVIGSEESFNISDLSVGNHTIYFEVKDDASEWSEQATESLIISLDPLNQPPVANAGRPYLGAVSDAISFDGSESYDEDGEIIEYLWDFGDETTGAGESITHTYTSPGNYTITLTVTDDDVYSATNTTTVTIVQSSGQNSGSTGAAGFTLNIPFPVIIVAEAAFIVIGILMFLFWMKRK